MFRVKQFSGRWIVALLAALSLAACGGGGSDSPSGAFDIGVYVDGRGLSGVQVAPGRTQTLSISAGQSIELDASEPVAWLPLGGGSSVTGSGSAVAYGGRDVTAPRA